MLNTQLPSDLAIPHVKYNTMRKENIHPHKISCTDIHSGIIYNRQKVEQSKFPSTDEWANKTCSSSPSPKAWESRVLLLWVPERKKQRPQLVSQRENSLSYLFALFRPSTEWKRFPSHWERQSALLSLLIQIISSGNTLMDTHRVFYQTSEYDRSPVKLTTNLTTTISQ